MLSISHNSIHLLIIITTDFAALYKFTGCVVLTITSFLAGVESGDQCLLNSEVLSCFSGIIMSVRSFSLFVTELSLEASLQSKDLLHGAKTREKLLLSLLFQRLKRIKYGGSIRKEEEG